MKQYFIYTVISVVVMALGLTFFTKAPVNTNTVVHEDGTVTVGSVAALENVDNPYVSIGGVKQYYFSSQTLATSSAVCSIKNPWNATSTILSIGMQVNTNGLGSPQSLYISTSSTAYASSSVALVASSTIKQGAVSDPIVWTPNQATSTSADVLGPGVFPVTGGRSIFYLKPGEFITWKTASTSPGATSYAAYLSGKCTAVLQSL